MRVDITPRRADVTPGVPFTVTVTIANTATVIAGYTLRVLGADPGWVTLDAEQISLFPDETRTLTATVTVPRGIPAGVRRIAVQVRELTPPEASTVAEIDLAVPEARSVQLRLDPLTVTGGRRGAFGLLVENTGNTMLRGRLAGDDAEGKVRFEFTPEVVALAPGEHAVVDLRAGARRHLAGSPAVHVLGIHLDDIPDDPFFAADPDSPVARDERAALATGTFVQRPLLSRGPLSLLGLLAAITVFAIVITVAMSRLVGQSAADRDLALQVAAARNAAATTGTSTLSGTVTLLTSGKPVRGVSVAVYAGTDTTTPLATTATDAKGAYSVGNLAAGSYKISFRGAGFVQLWYPGAATDADATAVTVAAGQSKAGLDVRLGGVPATISGTVVGDDVSAATLYLETAASGTTTQSVPANPPPNNGEAVVRTVPIGSDGAFTLTGVPSPSVYDLVVTKTGYATSTQRIDVGAGEDRKGVEIRLRKGDGLISGHVTSASGPLGGVTITATAGQSSTNTVSLTADDVGAFTLRELPTPGTFTIVASKGGYASQTLTVTLTAGQKLTGVAITLGQSAGSLSGTVTTTPGNAPAPGVSVTVTDGQLTVQTVTESSGQPGAWTVGGLPLPGTYTISFTRSDLATQTVAVSLDAAGNITPGSQGATITAAGIAVAMQPSTAVVSGTVAQPGGATVCDGAGHLGEATVTLNSGSSSYTVTTASVGSCGAYRIEQVPPGTYTLTISAGSGTTPNSQVLTVHAGDTAQRNVTLSSPASIVGRVTQDGAPLAGWTVLLYPADQYPGGQPRSTTTAADGTFSFPGVDAERYVVEVRATPGSSPAASQTVVVTPSANVQVNIEVPS